MFYSLVTCVFLLLALLVDSPATYQQCNAGCLGIDAVSIVPCCHSQYRRICLLARRYEYESHVSVFAHGLARADPVPRRWFGGCAVRCAAIQSDGATLSTFAVSPFVSHAQTGTAISCRSLARQHSLPVEILHYHTHELLAPKDTAQAKEKEKGEPRAD